MEVKSIDELKLTMAKENIVSLSADYYVTTNDSCESHSDTTRKLWNSGLSLCWKYIVGDESFINHIYLTKGSIQYENQNGELFEVSK